MSYTPNRGQPTVPEDVLDDLTCRFIINVPSEERDDVTRVMFQVELAHWFYLDWLCEERTELPPLSFRPFCQILFQHVPFLRCYLDRFSQVLEDFRTYKSSVPTFGAIIINEALTHCLMVQGYWAKASWGFPKGKVNADEPSMVCAIREVREETSFDCTPYISEDSYIEKTIRGTKTRLYLVPGVKQEVSFQPMTRKEIKDIRWFAIKDLPDSKAERTPGQNNYYMAMPFIRSLREWIKTKQRQVRKEKKRTKEKAKTSLSTTVATSVPQTVPTPQPRSTIDLHAFILQAGERETARRLANIEVEHKREKFGTSLWENVTIDFNWPSMWQEVRANYWDKAWCEAQ